MHTCGPERVPGLFHGDIPGESRLRHLTSCDLDETRQLVAGIFSPHDLSLASSRGGLNYAHDHAKVGDIGFSIIRYGAPVRVDVFEPQTFFLVQLPLRGHDRIVLGDSELHSSAHTGSIHDPSRPFSMNWSDDCTKLALRIERSRLEAHVASLLGMPLREPLTFATGMALDLGPGLAWKLTALEIFRSLRDRPEMLTNSLLRLQFEQMLMAGLLVWQPNSMAERLAQHASPAALPRHVTVVEDYMRNHLSEPITIEKLATLSGVSAKSLHNGFVRVKGMSPMKYLRELRMARVRHDLLDPGQPASVTTIVMRWGFYELGRFAAAYRRRYGELPSDTLQSRQ